MTMPGLPPAVRDRAAQAATDALLEWGHDADSRMSLEVVAAVTAVVAPEIERPLQARIEELKSDRDSEQRWADQYNRDAVALQARATELETALSRLNHACSHNIDDLPRARGIARVVLAKGGSDA